MFEGASATNLPRLNQLGLSLDYSVLMALEMIRQIGRAFIATTFVTKEVVLLPLFLQWVDDPKEMHIPLLDSLFLLLHQVFCLYQLLVRKSQHEFVL